MISTTQVWENVLIEIQARVTAFAYESWIEGLVPVCIYEDNVVLLCENSAKKRVVEERYIDVISESCKKVMPHNEGVLFILEEEREKYEKYANADIGEINSENIIVEETTCSFSPKCTFDNFIVGKSNEFAAAASKAVAQNPGTKYNPLFIYGGVGLGKTHLLNAIGNHIRKTNPKLRCMNISCERFTNELIEALRGNKHTDEMKEFRKRYRSVDVLMIDDIQFIAKTVSTQEELFHTFNDLYYKDKQIIICSDRPPQEIAPLEERLRTRFQGGVVADISEPDLETRIAILKSEALAEKQNIDDEILKLIANKVTTNIREMKGVLTKIICYSQLICKNVNDMEV
ncbi:MAG: chromosomal replication initiator protein DnaA, partial [Clostridiales bacterium]|nr:chromosomal replication initiator protein DnaA [Clostridiales bacterium]MDY5726323.1 chromosomal replication initiator protein DnaA [Eubacteriales bacterium]